MRSLRTALLLLLLAAGQCLAALHVVGHDADWRDSQPHCAFCVSNPSPAPPPSAAAVILGADRAPSGPAVAGIAPAFRSAARPDSIRGPPRILAAKP
jgi:hypothetical protein